MTKATKTACCFFTALTALAASQPVLAESPQWSITPTVGYRVGGEIRSDFIDFFADLEVDDSASFGLTVERRFTDNLRLELLWSHQDGKLIEDRFLSFEPERVLFDLDVDYYQVGLMYQWNPGRIHPFVVASLGATVLDPQPAQLSTETRPSGSIGGGAKFMFSDHVGLRLEGRVFTTLLEDGDDFYCSDYCSHDDDFLVQGEARAGLVLEF